MLDQGTVGRAPHLAYVEVPIVVCEACELCVACIDWRQAVVVRQMLSSLGDPYDVA